MTATNYLEAEILDHILGTSAFTMPTNTFVKLHTADPGEDATTAPAGNTTRAAVDFAAASSPGGTAASSTAASWTAVSTTETYSHFSIWDASTAGNPLLTGALTASVSVTAGDNFSIPSGQLTVTCS